MRRILPLLLLVATPLGCALPFGNGSAASAASVPFRGVWAEVPQAAVRKPAACSEFQRYHFEVEGDEVRVKVSTANRVTNPRSYSNEQLVVHRGDGDRWQLKGEHTGPGPTDGPVAKPVTYDLTYDAAKGVLSGTRKLDQAATTPVVLIRTDFAPTDCPRPTPSTAASPPAPKADATPSP